MNNMEPKTIRYSWITNEQQPVWEVWWIIVNKSSHNQEKRNIVKNYITSDNNS